MMLLVAAQPLLTEQLIRQPRSMPVTGQEEASQVLQ